MQGEDFNSILYEADVNGSNRKILSLGKVDLAQNLFLDNYLLMEYQYRIWFRNVDSGEMRKLEKPISGLIINIKNKRLITYQKKLNMKVKLLQNSIWWG